MRPNTPQYAPHLVAALVGEVKLRLLGAEVHAGLLAHHLGVDGLVGLHAYHKLVPAALLPEDVPGHVGELQPHLGLALVQCLAAAQDEGHA